MQTLIYIYSNVLQPRYLLYIANQLCILPTLTRQFWTRKSSTRMCWVAVEWVALCWLSLLSWSTKHPVCPPLENTTRQKWRPATERGWLLSLIIYSSPMYIEINYLFYHILCYHLWSDVAQNFHGPYMVHALWIPSPTPNGNFVQQCFKCGNTIKICNGTTLNLFHDCHVYIATHVC